MLNEMWDNCKGCPCLFIDEDYYDCEANVKPSFNNKFCPCHNCLVKVTCDEPCLKFLQYKNEFLGWLK